MNTFAVVGFQLTEKTATASEFIGKLFLREAELFSVIGDAQSQETEVLPKFVFASIHREIAPPVYYTIMIAFTKID